MSYRDIVDLKLEIDKLLNTNTNRTLTTIQSSLKQSSDIINKNYSFTSANKTIWLTNDENFTYTLPYNKLSDIKTIWDFCKINDCYFQYPVVWNKTFRLTDSSQSKSLNINLNLDDNKYYYLCCAIYVCDLKETPYLYYNERNLFTIFSGSTQLEAVNNSSKIVEYVPNQDRPITKCNIYIPSQLNFSHHRLPENSNIYINPMIFMSEVKLPPNELPRIYPEIINNQLIYNENEPWIGSERDCKIVYTQNSYCYGEIK